MLEAVGSVPTNKYAEGYPGKRYYGGCEVVDEIEQLAIDRAKELFGAEHANVQPHAGAQTNMAVYAAVLRAGRHDPRRCALDHGGHLTHGHKVNFCGRLYTIAGYGVSRETMIVDYDEVLAQAKEARPKLIVCGGSAYPRTVETDKFREIADEVGALLLCDMAHFAGLVAAGLHPNPVEHCDFVTSTTHKTLAGPRAGFILCREEHAQAVDSRRLPGDAGRPARAHDRGEGDVLQDRDDRGVPRVPGADPPQRRRARRDAAGGRARAPHRRHRHASDAVDLRNSEWTGKAAEERLHEVEITVNRNTVPFDERPPTVASGVRIGTPAMTMRGFDEDDFREVGADHRDALTDAPDLDGLRARVAALCAQRPLYPGLPRLHDVRRVSGERRLTVVEHPLVQHKLSYLRDKETPTVHFRKLVNEITLLLTYEATKDMPTEAHEIETPLETMTAQRISGKKVAVCPVLRAGMGMLDGVLSLVSSARVGFIGMYRDEETLEPVQYYVEAAGRPRRARRDRPRPDARDRPLELRRDRRREGGGRADGDARLHRRGAGGDRGAPRASIRTSTSSAPRSTAA